MTYPLLQKNKFSRVQTYYPVLSKEDRILRECWCKVWTHDHIDAKHWRFIIGRNVISEVRRKLAWDLAVYTTLTHHNTSLLL
jgi:hypothetical protein